MGGRGFGTCGGIEHHVSIGLLNDFVEREGVHVPALGFWCFRLKNEDADRTVAERDKDTRREIDERDSRDESSMQCEIWQKDEVELAADEHE
jgi:hypothetical protein